MAEWKYNSLYSSHTLAGPRRPKKQIFFSKYTFFATDRSAACVVEEALWRLASHGRVELVEVAARVILAQPAAAPAILIIMLM